MELNFSTLDNKLIRFEQISNSFLHFEPNNKRLVDLSALVLNKKPELTQKIYLSNLKVKQAKTARRQEDLSPTQLTSSHKLEALLNNRNNDVAKR